MYFFRRVIGWWLDGWKLLFFFAALYIVVNILLFAPILGVDYFADWDAIDKTWKMLIAVFYFGVYLPLVIKAAAIYLKGSQKS